MSPLTVLRHDETEEVLAYLARDPIESVFLRGLILRTGLDLGRRHGCFVAYRGAKGKLGGIMLMSTLVVPFVTTKQAAPALADALANSPFPLRNIVGRRETVEALWDAMRPWRPRPRLHRRSQPVYMVNRATLRYMPAPPLRRASLSDLDLLVKSGAAMMIEEVEEDPLASRPELYRSFVRDRILRGDEFLWTDEQGLCFKCNVSSRTPEAAQIEGVYTPAARRRQGFASRGLSEVCHRLLDQMPCLCLYVNDFNLAAIDLYKQLGFERTFEYQSIFFD
jgi:ribosomal protein S18 acetylase RimI-like enzyme